MKNDVYIEIESIRKDAGLSKGEMAAALGVSARQYSQWSVDDAPQARLSIARKIFERKEASNETLLKAIYESKRESLLTAYINAQEESIERFSEPYIYAYYVRMCPIYQVDDDNDPFADAYNLHRDFAEKVLKTCGQHIDKKIKLDFYDLEAMLGGRINRHAIIDTLTYWQLCSCYDEWLFENLLSHCPAEAKYMTHNFDFSSIKI